MTCWLKLGEVPWGSLCVKQGEAQKVGSSTLEYLQCRLNGKLITTCLLGHHWSLGDSRRSLTKIHAWLWLKCVDAMLVGCRDETYAPSLCPPAPLAWPVSWRHQGRWLETPPLFPPPSPPQLLILPHILVRPCHVVHYIRPTLFLAGWWTKCFIKPAAQNFSPRELVQRCGIRPKTSWFSGPFELNLKLLSWSLLSDFAASLSKASLKSPLPSRAGWQRGDA